MYPFQEIPTTEVCYLKNNSFENLIYFSRKVSKHLLMLFYLMQDQVSKRIPLNYFWR